MTHILEVVAVGLEVLNAVEVVATGGAGSVHVHVQGRAYLVTVTPLVPSA